MKGIILAGGRGTRLHPMTLVINKHLLPVYDKPMIYYPLSIFMLADIIEVMIISNPEDIDKFKKILGDGSQWGLSLQFAVQEKPRGVGEAFLIAKDFIGDDTVALALGDNIFYKDGMQKLLKESKDFKDGGKIFAYHVKDPERFGVVEIDDLGNPISIEEKPCNPKSNFAVIGLYFYDNKVVEIAENLKPSKRGELEITDINNVYLKHKKLSVKKIGRGAAWLDVGKPAALLEASQFIYLIEKRQGLKIADLDQIAKEQNLIP